MKSERIGIGRQLTYTEKNKLKVFLTSSKMRFKDTLGAIYIHNSEFFKISRPLFPTLTAFLLDSTIETSLSKTLDSLKDKN